MEPDRDVEPSETESSDLEPTDLGYGRAMVRGVLIGWIVMPVVTLLIMSLGAPDWSWADRIAISLMVGFWVGLFFGGAASVTVFARGYEKREEDARAHRAATAAGATEAERAPKVPAGVGGGPRSDTGGDIAA